MEGILTITGQMDRAKQAGPRHGIFGLAQAKWAAARHGPVSARARLCFAACELARHDTISCFFFLNFL